MLSFVSPWALDDVLRFGPARKCDLNVLLVKIGSRPQFYPDHHVAICRNLTEERTEGGIEPRQLVPDHEGPRARLNTD